MRQDILTEMYAMQLDLDYRIINERRVDKTVDEWVIGLTIAMESEIDEIRREVNWKWWKNPKEVDTEALQGEVIDMWHFLLSMSREVGLTPADIHQLAIKLFRNTSVVTVAVGSATQLRTELAHTGPVEVTGAGEGFEMKVPTAPGHRP